MHATTDIRARPDAAGRPAAKPSRSRGGRPTKADAALRDERLLDIATAMFLEHGFEATSMDRLAEAAAIGKATLYARYADKAALFAAVLHRRILEVYAPLEDAYRHPVPDRGLHQTLLDLADELVSQSLADESVTLGRILSAQGQRFPALVHLAIQEGYGRKLRLLEAILGRYADDSRYRLGDLPLTAELFLSLVLGEAIRFRIYGLAIDPGHVTRRTKAAVEIFVRGLTV